MKAVEMAWETRSKPVGVMFQSDQGSYCGDNGSGTARKLLGSNRMARFFRSLKNEWVPVTGYVSFSDATRAITD